MVDYHRTFVTASWKCSSATGIGVLLVKENNRCNGAGWTLRAAKSIFRVVLVTTTLCSLGRAFSEGKAEEKDHSSSSLVTVGALGCAAAWGTGVAGLELNDPPPRIANGSEVAGLGGAAKADCMERGGCGVLDDDVAELKAEKLEKPGGGVDVADAATRAVLFWVTDDKSAGPGMSMYVISIRPAGFSMHTGTAYSYWRQSPRQYHRLPQNCQNLRQ